MVGQKVALWVARLNAGFGLETVAKEMGVTVNTLIKWEQMKRKPSLENCCKLCSMYDIPYEFIQWELEKEPERISLTVNQLFSMASSLGYESVEEFITAVT